MIWLSTEYFHFMGMCTFQTFHGFSSTLNLRDSEEYGKYLCFPMLFLYYVNSLFPVFGNCMDFCFTQNIWETQTFKCFFTYFSRIMRIHVFHVLGIIWISASPENLRDPLIWNACVFARLSRAMKIHFSYVLGTAWISAS